MKALDKQAEKDKDDRNIQLDVKEQKDRLDNEILIARKILAEAIEEKK
jgi:hypothetical protein